MKLIDQFLSTPRPSAIKSSSSSLPIHLSLFRATVVNPGVMVHLEAAHMVVVLLVDMEHLEVVPLVDMVPLEVATEPLVVMELPQVIPQWHRE